jgi:hypothetical protein
MNQPVSPQCQPPMRKSKRAGLWIFLSIAYIAIYVVLSRRGYAEAEKYDFAGFYYFTPEESNAWRWKNYGCVVIFYPLNFIDRCLGTGRPIGTEPLWRLSS